MSQRRERVAEALPDDLGGALARLEEYYHVPVLAALLSFMLWVRARSWEAFVNGDQVLYNGNDAWYHLRQVTYSVYNWPSTMPYDPWTSFPTGTYVGQFGTLFDQLVATAALVVGLGSPTEHQIAMTHLFAPVVFGTLTAIPVYVIGRRLGGRPAGLLAVLVLALTPGSFLRRSLVGFSDHHIAETFFVAVAMALVMVAVTSAERDRPIWELLVQRDWDAVREPALWAALAGLGITLYIWTWPPGVVLVGILGAFYLLKLAADYLRGESPDHAAFTAIVSMAVVAVLTLLTIDTFGLDATKLSLLQPLFAVAVAAGAAVMALLARQWDDRALDPRGYPVAIAGILVIGLALFAVALPDLFDYMVRQASRVVGYDATAEVRTVGEAQPVPLDQATQYFYNSYGLAFFVAVAGLLYGVWKLYDDGPRGELLLVVLFGLFMTAATLTQRRFDYYLVVPVAALSGYLLTRVLGLTDVGTIRTVRDVEAYQVFAVLAVVLLLVGPFVSFPASGARGDGTDLTNPQLAAVQISDRTAPGEVRQWDGSLRWMANETPEEGQYGAPGNEQMAHYGSYRRANDYDYPDGSYGVMAWWDYGHFITTRGERIPNANPFQQNARSSAVYLLEPNATSANRMLVSDDGEQTRYVMIDWKLATPLSGKFSAPTAFYDSDGYPTDAPKEVSGGDLFRPVYDAQTGRLAFTVQKQRHYDNMRTRLYKFHGSRIEAQPIVIDYDEVQGPNGRTFAVKPTGPNASVIRSFDDMEGARAFVEEDGTAQVGGIGRYPSRDVPALEHYRLVRTSEASAYDSGRYQRNAIRNMRGLGVCQQPGQCLQTDQQVRATDPQWVKTFERVDGATVEGTGPPNATVTASVRMEMPVANSTFTYRQQATTGENGEFTMTLPYSTTGYENWGPEQGYTNVSVRATGPYRIATQPTVDDNLTTRRYSATVNVTEAQVIGEDDDPVQATLEEEVLSQPEGSTNTSSARRPVAPSTTRLRSPHARP